MPLIGFTCFHCGHPSAPRLGALCEECRRLRETIVAAKRAYDLAVQQASARGHRAEDVVARERANDALHMALCAYAGNRGEAA